MFDPSFFSQLSRAVQADLLRQAAQDRRRHTHLAEAPYSDLGRKQSRHQPNVPARSLAEAHAR